MANIPIFNFMAKNVQFINVNYNKLSSKCQIGGANLEATTVSDFKKHIAVADHILATPSVLSSNLADGWL